MKMEYDIQKIKQLMLNAEKKIREAGMDEIDTAAFLSARQEYNHCLVAELVQHLEPEAKRAVLKNEFLYTDAMLVEAAPYFGMVVPRGKKLEVSEDGKVVKVNFIKKKKKDKCCGKCEH